MAGTIDQDRNGKLEREEFIEFVRLTLVMDLPKSKIGVLRQKKFDIDSYGQYSHGLQRYVLSVYGPK